jgi:glycosyltransferase involved in cell wall biosynthesis
VRICYIASDISIPAPTGGSTHTLEETRAFMDQGNSVCIVSRRERGQPKNAIINEAFTERIYRLIFFPFSRSIPKVSFEESKRGLVNNLYHFYLRTFYTYYVGFRAARLIKNKKLDLILERSTSLGAGAVAAKLTHRPLVVEVIADIWVSSSLRTAKKILVYDKDMVPGWVDRSKLVKVYAAVNTRLFHPMVNGNKIRAKYALKNRRVIGYAGGFWEYHGIDILIEASKSVISTNPEVVFLLVGPDYEKYESFAKELGVADHFIFTGPITYEEVPNYLAAADLLVAPYFPKKHKQGSPLKLFEYLALEKPVIASNISAIREVLKNGENALLVPPGDAISLATAISKVLQNQELANLLAKKGYELVKEKYTWDYLAQSVTQQTKLV